MNLNSTSKAFSPFPFFLHESRVQIWFLLDLIRGYLLNIPSSCQFVEVYFLLSDLSMIFISMSEIRVYSGRSQSVSFYVRVE